MRRASATRCGAGARYREAVTASDWINPASAVLAAVITISPILVDAVRRRTRRSETDDLRSRRTGGRIRARWWVLSTAIATAAVIAAGIARPPWGWLPPAIVCALLLAAVEGWARLRRRRMPVLEPGVQRMLDGQTRPQGGFPYDRDALPDLVVVYTANDLTDPGTRSRDREEPSTGPQQEAPSQQRLTFEDVLAEPVYLHLAITGEAGIGKTSLLEFWAHELGRRARGGAAVGARARSPLERLVPLLVAARELVGMAHVGDAFCEGGADLLRRPPGPGMRWLVMIDAFDEITNVEDRLEVERIVFAAIDEATGRDRAARFVLTTRGLTNERWRSFDSRGITEFRLQPFTQAQLRTFLVKRETSAKERDPDSKAQAAAEAKADRFLKRWQGADNLLDLLRLPLLARVAATVYFEDEQSAGIPARRVDIYHDAVEHWISQFAKRLAAAPTEHSVALALLREWGDRHGRADTVDAVRGFLGGLAVRHLADSRRSITEIACEMLGVRLRPKDPSAGPV